MTSSYVDRTAAEVIADTVWDGVRLVTFRATLPMIIQKHLIRHRTMSFSFSSSRAIPIKRQIELVKTDPFIPLQWPKNKAGMSATEYLIGHKVESADRIWLASRDLAINSAYSLGVDLGIHKEITNRLLEPWMWATCIVSTTMPGLENFFALRDHEDAQPEMQVLARAMRKALEESTPREGDLHIPFLSSLDSDNEEEERFEALMIRAVARCARVSYGREMEEKPFADDEKLVEKLIRSGHWSPMEHVGIAADPNRYAQDLGNFEWPWMQLRHHWLEYLPSIAARIE